MATLVFSDVIGRGAWVIGCCYVISRRLAQPPVLVLSRRAEELEVLTVLFPVFRDVPLPRTEMLGPAPEVVETLTTNPAPTLAEADTDPFLLITACIFAPGIDAPTPTETLVRFWCVVDRLWQPEQAPITVVVESTLSDSLW